MLYISYMISIINRNIYSLARALFFCSKAGYHQFSRSGQSICSMK